MVQFLIVLASSHPEGVPMLVVTVLLFLAWVLDSGDRTRRLTALVKALQAPDSR